ncbi:MAG: glycosyltransferase family 9 protein [Candidatus Cloacimonetes bacterium]|jgi:heptosyltransferase-2|nr:glycosyltransferase family 9 protein [Candidatus Cloacimonadota bacterium]MDD2506966.1 glycosyltransferase family 9 protein [Candidatus Cloacimonadota bacterium]MDD4147529.1 glycosyltransferase family 9 protein [Candidatus Cloacimonadota bacterium]MDD4560499.1 glycosyltransferase family 9 protein [Candidatus Cloacimonadota bacterium]
MKILILRLSSLGDIVLTQPVAAWLRTRYPEAQIDFVVKEQFVELVTLMGCELNPIIYRKSFKAHYALYKTGYDIVLDLHAKLSTYLLKIASRGKTILTYQKARSIRERMVKGDKSLKIGTTVDLYRTALQRIDEQAKLDVPRLYPSSHSHIPDLPVAAKRIAIFPGAAHNTKRYPANYYKELIKNSPNGFQYIILGSQSEQDLCQTIAEDYKAKNLCGELSFTQLLALLETCDWVISSDSGPMHLAAALQRPQIAIFGATHPRLGFAPQNPQAHVLCAELECQPCSLHGSDSCPLGHFKCMHDISVESILNIINQNKGSHNSQ